jgi:hypothetical protein
VFEERPIQAALCQPRSEPQQLQIESSAASESLQVKDLRLWSLLILTPDGQSNAR